MAEPGTTRGDGGGARGWVRRGEPVGGRCRAGHGNPAVGRWVLVAICFGLLALATPPRGQAEHESANALTFAPVAGSAAPAGSGTGEIAYNGGFEPVSQWTATFRFAGLAADADYTVVVQGRFGEDGSAEAAAFTETCSFRASATGEGGCWDYHLGLVRLGVAQLRLGGEAGEPVLQATRAGGGPGTIVSTPNRHSPAPTAPSGTAATPLATPVATPLATP